MFFEIPTSLSWRCHGNGLDFGQNMALNKAYCACNEPGDLRDVTTLLYCSFIYGVQLQIWHYFSNVIPHYCIATLTYRQKQPFLFLQIIHISPLLYPTFLIYCLDDF